MRLLLAGSLVSLAACATAHNLEPTATLGEGRSQISASASIVAANDTWPFWARATFHYGLLDNLDVKAGVSVANGLEAGAKLRLTPRDSAFGFALAPDLWANTGSRLGTLRGGARVRAITALRFGAEHELILAPIGTVGAYDSSLSSGESIARVRWGAGAALGTYFRIFERFRLMPELSVMWMVEPATRYTFPLYELSIAYFTGALGGGPATE